MARPVSDIVKKEIIEFKDAVSRLRSGALDDLEFKKIRLLYGIYGQKQKSDEGIQMIRVKIPGGIMNSEQMRALSILAEKYSTGIGHITTRQNFQFHFIKLDDVPAILELLDSVGLTSREGCGNSWRNIVGSPLDGIHKDSVFDTYPYLDATFKHFLRHPEFQKLPRKFKVNFSSGEGDLGQTSMNCIGAIAKIQNGKRGFKVLVGGGLGASPHHAQLFSEFMPEELLIPYMEAITRHFNKVGQRENQMMARIKFLVAKEGIETFKANVEKEYQAQKIKEIKVAIPAEKIPDVKVVSGGAIPPAFEAWKRVQTFEQKQNGFSYVFLKMIIGDLTAKQFIQIADLLDKYGNGEIRTTNEQDFVIPWVKNESLTALYADLVKIGLAEVGSNRIEDVLSCPGGHTCNLAITKSKHLGSYLTDYIKEKYPSANPANEDLKGILIKISGCPNSCSQHRGAPIGFQGGVMNVSGKKAPVYQLYLGGEIMSSTVKTGKAIAKYPARNVPKVIDSLIEMYRKDKGKNFVEWANSQQPSTVMEALKPFQQITVADVELFKEPNENEDFVFTGIGEAECAI